MLPILFSRLAVVKLGDLILFSRGPVLVLRAALNTDFTGQVRGERLTLGGDVGAAVGGKGQVTHIAQGVGAEALDCIFEVKSASLGHQVMLVVYL